MILVGVYAVGLVAAVVMMVKAGRRLRAQWNELEE